MKRLLFHLAVAFLLITRLCAQADAAAPAKKLPHSVRLLCVDEVAQATQLILAEKTEQGWVGRWRVGVSAQLLSDRIGFQTRAIGVAIDPTPPPKNGSFHAAPAMIKETLIVKPFAELALPASDSVTAILIAGPKPEVAPYRVIVLDAAEQQFGKGKVLIQNFTPHTVAGVFGGKAAKILSGKSELIEPGIDQAADMAQVTLAKQNGQAWEPFYDTRWPGKADYRSYLLLLPREDGSINAFVMPEYPPFR
jgi:hypothetical protein